MGDDGSAEWSAGVRPDGPGGFAVRTGIDEGQARELNAVAGILEALALSLSPRFDDVAIAELRSANERFRSHSDHAAALAVDDHDLHRRLCESCEDERLLGTLAPVRRAIHRWRATVAPEPAAVERAAAEHDAIIDALAAGDHPTAVQRLREHVAAGLPDLLAAARPHGPPRGPGDTSS